MHHMELQTIAAVELMDVQPELKWFMRPYLVDFLIEIHQNLPPAPRDAVPHHEHCRSLRLEAYRLQTPLPARRLCSALDRCQVRGCQGPRSYGQGAQPDVLQRIRRVGFRPDGGPRAFDHWLDARPPTAESWLRIESVVAARTSRRSTWPDSSSRLACSPRLYLAQVFGSHQGCSHPRTIHLRTATVGQASAHR